MQLERRSDIGWRSSGASQTGFFLLTGLYVVAAALVVVWWASRSPQRSARGRALSAR
jgi:hypothetical protein